MLFQPRPGGVPAILRHAGQTASVQSQAGAVAQQEAVVGALEGSDGRISPPERLSVDHDLAQFNCGEPSLDHWLRSRALANETSGASRTYVVCANGCVVGYYALAAGAVAHTEATSRAKRNMPDPVPVILI